MSERLTEANQTVKKYSYWAAGVGLIPLPVLDVAAITGVQIKMLKDLSKAYDRKFSDDRARVAIATLVGSVTPVALRTGTLSSFLKAVPGIGQIAGAILVPTLAAAATLALGQVFIQHLETGGTLLDFDPEKLKAYYKAEFEKAQAAGTELHPASAPAAAPVPTPTVAN